VKNLIALEPALGFGFGAVADAFVMDDAGQRRVAHAEAGLAHLEGQIGVLEVGR